MEKTMSNDEILDSAKKYIETHLLPIVQSVDEALEGNLFFHHETTKICTDFLQKQYNLLEIINSLSISLSSREKEKEKEKENTNIRILEIGFNAGFSALVFLLAHPKTKITCVDIGFHRYTYACYEKLRETFGDDRIEFLLGDSVSVLPKINVLSDNSTKYDVFYLDGSHSTSTLESDLFHVGRLMQENAIIVMNDTNDPTVNTAFETFIGRMQLQSFLQENTPYHKIRKYNGSRSLSIDVLPSGVSWPKRIYQLWHSLEDVSEQMKQRTEVLKIQHPDFHYQLFFLDTAREFIRENFESKVLTAFDSIIPFAFKSDLWRYCMLYKYGGIYLDMKYECTNGFRFSHLDPAQEYYVFDVNRDSIYNGFIVAKPNNSIFLHTINQIVKHTRERFYGVNDLTVTGPGLLGKMVPEEIKLDIRLQHQCLNYNKYILQDGIPILKVYHRYYEERTKFQSRTYYDYWICREMYG
jgi:mannosyltransferase OCH1-like enzyme